jgi:hypothetical protein
MAGIFCQEGFDVYVEHGLKLSGDRMNYVDLLARREDLAVICEVETTPRHVLDNLSKAELLDMPLWIIVPSRKVKSEVIRKLRKAGYRSRKSFFHISMPDELQQGLKSYFPNSSSANTTGKNGKINCPGPENLDGQSLWEITNPNARKEEDK